METTVTRRLLAILKQLKYKTQQEIGDLLGVSRGAAGTYERGTQSPSVDSLELVFKAHPEINTEYVLKGKGAPFITGGTPPKSAALTATSTPPLAEGETATSAAGSDKVAEPLPDYTSTSATQQTLYIELLKEQVADLKADKVRHLAEIDRLRAVGKTGDSSDAADDLENDEPTEPAPTAPRGVLPLPRLRVQQIRGLIRYQE